MQWCDSNVHINRISFYKNGVEQGIASKEREVLGKLGLDKLKDLSQRFGINEKQTSMDTSNIPFENISGVCRGPNPCQSLQQIVEPVSTS